MKILHLLALSSFLFNLSYSHEAEEKQRRRLLPFNFQNVCGVVQASIIQNKEEGSYGLLIPVTSSKEAKGWENLGIASYEAFLRKGKPGAAGVDSFRAIVERYDSSLFRKRVYSESDGAKLYVGCVADCDAESLLKLEKAERLKHIEMIVSVSFNANGSFSAHMGIHRLVTYEGQENKRISMPLHAFALSAVNHLYSSVKAMITFPMPAMTKITMKNAPDGALMVGYNNYINSITVRAAQNIADPYPYFVNIPSEEEKRLLVWGENTEITESQNNFINNFRDDEGIKALKENLESRKSNLFYEGIEVGCWPFSSMRESYTCKSLGIDPQIVNSENPGYRWFFSGLFNDTPGPAIILLLDKLFLPVLCKIRKFKCSESFLSITD